MLEEMCTFKDLPLWVSERLSVVMKDFGGVAYDDYELYLESLAIDDCNPENNKGSAVFLTTEEIIKVDFTLDSITIEKRRLSNLVKVSKKIFAPMEDAFKDQDLIWQLVDLVFLGGDNISLTLPVNNPTNNLHAYEKLISKF